MAPSPSEPPAPHHPRLLAYQQLWMALRTGHPVWLDFLERLPLCLGEAGAERVAPFALSDDVQALFAHAVDSLVDLIKRRRDPAYDREKQRVLLPDESRRVVLWPQRFNPRTLAEGSPLREVVRLALLQSPELDGGLLESWLARSAGGRDLVEVLIRLLAKSFGFARDNPAWSGVGLLSHLSMLNSLLVSKDRIKRAQLKNLPYARLDRAIGMALHAAFRTAAQEALVLAGQPAADTPEHRDLLLVLVGMGPLPFFAIQRSELAEPINPYGLSAELDSLLAPAFQSALERSNEPEHLLRTLSEATGRAGPLHGALLRQAAIGGLRRQVLEHLVAAEDPAEESDALLASAYPDDGALALLLEDAAIQTRLCGALATRLADRRRMESAWRETQRLLTTLERIRERGPSWRTDDVQAREWLQQTLERYLLYRLDLFAEVHLNQARRRVVDRRASASSGALREEYEAGRLYRIAADKQPLLRARLVRQEGQLFVDLKGYTRRTAQAKELVMAEFLQREFYEPILEAAKHYRTGAALVAAEQNIDLVNLLGDAVAFSGNIAVLVDLARDIQAIFRAYRAKLQSLSPETEEGELQALRLQVDTRRAALASERSELESELQRLKREVFQRSSLDTVAMVNRLQQDYEESFAALRAAFRALQAAGKRSDKGREAQELKQRHQTLREERNQLLQRLRGMPVQERNAALVDLLCQPLLERLRTIEERLRAMDEELRTMEEALDEETRRQLGGGLEAGLFIAHGMVGEAIRLQDDIWGTQQVIISERVNEAARGTARNLVIKERLDEMLTRERERRSAPGLEYPFRVTIAETRTLSLPPEISRRWARALAERDPEQLERFLKHLEEELRGQWAAEDGAGGTTTDIYNLGEAMSAAALDAYLRQTRNTHFFFRIQIRPSELSPEIGKRFFLPDDMLSLIAGGQRGVEEQEPLLFRYVGQVLFRGFEISRPTPVYEILRPDSPFVRLLVEHHLESWLEEARRHPECKLDGLEGFGLT